MQIAAVSTFAASIRDVGVPVLTIDGIDRVSGVSAPMTVFARERVGRSEGYGSLNSALTAARNLSRGASRPAVLVERSAMGAYQVREAVWSLFDAPVNEPADRAPFRRFHFEDGSFSQYTAWSGTRRIEVQARDYFRSRDEVTRWLVDGSRVFEVTRAGGDGRGR